MVSIQPDQGGSVQVEAGCCWAFVVEFWDIYMVEMNQSFCEREQG